MTRMLVLAITQGSPGSPGEVGYRETGNPVLPTPCASQGGCWARDTANGPTPEKPWWAVTGVDGRPLRQTTAGLFDRR
jgi:hypothetical protein